MEETFEYKVNKISIDGIDLSYKTAGQGHPIFVAHGWGADSNYWLGIMKELSLKGFQMIVPDLPGFGNTPAPKEIWGAKEYADFLCKFIKKIELKDFTIIGHSFGGGVAMILAKECEGIKNVILCDAAVVRAERLDIRQKIAKALANWGQFISNTPIYPILRKILYKFAGASDYYLANEQMREIFKKVITEDLLYATENVKQPCLIIWGEKDVATPIEDGVLLNKRINGSKLEIVPGARHNPYRSEPQKTSQIIINFLKYKI
ncbi:MAG: alpha/beta hydrolase [Candidatus Pacebacteria bacterium]|nr:alpha/beta hydrolase [Candidatus Paceibacterota bacterium]